MRMSGAISRMRAFLSKALPLPQRSRQFYGDYTQETREVWEDTCELLFVAGDGRKRVFARSFLSSLIFPP
jgi:hypothetical protein